MKKGSSVDEVLNYVINYLDDIETFKQNLIDFAQEFIDEINLEFEDVIKFVGLNDDVILKKTKQAKKLIQRIKDLNSRRTISHFPIQHLDKRYHQIKYKIESISDLKAAIISSVYLNFMRCASILNIEMNDNGFIRPIPKRKSNELCYALQIVKQQIMFNYIANCLFDPLPLTDYQMETLNEVVVCSNNSKYLTMLLSQTIKGGRNERAKK